MNFPRPHSVLIVDDDEPTRKLLVALMRRSGFETDVARDGRAAIELLRRRPFSCVLLDLMMPEVTGTDVVAYIAGAGIDVPVVLCTAAPPARTSDFDSSVVRAVVRKPFDIVQLVATVCELVGTEPRQARVLIVDDDMRSRYVMRAFLGTATPLEAENGDEALQAIRDNRPDAVLLDLLLPGRSGEEVLRTIASDPDLQGIPVVIVTSRTAAELDHDTIRHASGVIYKGDLTRATLSDALTAALTGANTK